MSSGYPGPERPRTPTSGLGTVRAVQEAMRAFPGALAAAVVSVREYVVELAEDNE